MATIRAAWHRTIQTKPYESEKLELAVESMFIPSVEGGGHDEMLAAVATLSRDLTTVGDALILERLQAHGKGETEAPPRSRQGSRSAAPPPDDPYSR